MALATHGEPITMRTTELGESISDDQLVELVRKGDAENGIAGLQARYGRRILHFVRGLVRDPHLAADVTQEVFEKVFLKNHLYEAGTNFRAWLFEVARNQALTALRAARRRPRPISSMTLEDEDDPLAAVQEERECHAVEEEELMLAFRRAVDELPEHYRTVFNLCVRDGSSYQDAARTLALPPGTVGIRIMRARKRLFATLGKHLGRLRRPPACFEGGHLDR
jgi:RNA polymerase sigma-70 factor (ECF subfamily)